MVNALTSSLAELRNDVPGNSARKAGRIEPIVNETDVLESIAAFVDEVYRIANDDSNSRSPARKDANKTRSDLCRRHIFVLLMTIAVVERHADRIGVSLCTLSSENDFGSYKL